MTPSFPAYYRVYTRYWLSRESELIDINLTTNNYILHSFVPSIRSSPPVMAESSGVDTSPISPVERRNSLEKYLQHRPGQQDLKERHILLDTNVAPSLQAAQQELARQKAADSLKKHLEKRPDREDLVERNILPSSTAAPALQAHARELEKHMLADNLEHKIQSRPKPEELIHRGILEEDEDPTRPAQ
ncbi:RPEL repeat protein [Histoplasma ohiense]|nr:RPEL repeat protein [Histoplasma ohiense (nom. inval.)]